MSWFQTVGVPGDFQWWLFSSSGKVIVANLSVGGDVSISEACRENFDAFRCFQITGPGDGVEIVATEIS